MKGLDSDVYYWIHENEPVSVSEIRKQFGRNGIKRLTALLEQYVVFEAKGNYWTCGGNPFVRNKSTRDDELGTGHLPRRFELVRSEDVSGSSGEGVVAVGVEYPDGAVHMQWRNSENADLETDSNGVSFKPAPDGIEATEEIHGHGGRTEVRWVDGE